jgi:hypothetical protein
MIERIHKAIDSKAKIWAIALLWCLLISNLIVPRQWGFYGKGDWDLTYSTFEMARSMGIITIGCTGALGGKMSELSDVLLNVPSNDTPRIQESHILIGHIICELVEAQLFA